MKVILDENNMIGKLRAGEITMREYMDYNARRLGYMKSCVCKTTYFSMGIHKHSIDE